MPGATASAGAMDAHAWAVAANCATARLSMASKAAERRSHARMPARLDPCAGPAFTTHRSITLRRNAGKDPGVAVAFEDPTGGDHLIEHRGGRGVAVIRRAAHAVVVGTIERNRSSGAVAAGVGKAEVERDGLELPVGTGLDAGALAPER